MRLMIVPLLAAGVALAGCAKNSYVQREVGEVNQKVDAVSAEVEKTHPTYPEAWKGARVQAYRTLGRTGWKISDVVMGAGRIKGEKGSELVRAALDRGVTFIDTADVYGNGHNEELLSRALTGRRHEAIVATKFGNTRLPDGKQAICGRPDYVIEACEASLTRLKTDVIDLYYLHRVDANVPIEDTVGAMASLVAAGAVGLVTTHDLALARVADALAPLAANVHFEDHLEAGAIAFDYRLRPGVVEKSNALELMRAVGLEV